MAEDSKNRFPIVREAVASFTTRDQFRDAVGKLLAAGFAPADLSVLASHDSLEVAGNVAGYPGAPGQFLLAGLTDEVVFIAPLTIAGFALVSGGPVAAAIAAITTAGLSGVAFKELLDRYSANRHSAAFATALEAGAVLLWARCVDPALEAVAARILAGTSGRNVHIHARKP
jgi:hypothetical protein